MGRSLFKALAVLVLAFAYSGQLAQGEGSAKEVTSSSGIGVKLPEADAVAGEAEPEAEPSEDEGADGEEGEGDNGEGEEEEKEDEEAPTNPDTGISIMLLGSIAFMMSLFYVTNTSDPDFKVYSWEVINKTISIFSAVLLFQATQSVVMFYTLGKGVEEEAGEERRRRLGEAEGEAEEESLMGELIVAFCMMLFWYMALQGTLAYLTGAITLGKQDQSDEELAEITHTAYKQGKLTLEQRQKFEDMHVNLKCFGVLIGHITGFAAINALGVVQQMCSSETGIFESAPMKQLMAFVVCAFGFFVLSCVHKVTDIIRNRVAMGDDGQIDEAEEMWQEETAEVEDDVIGLAISFLFIQAVRFQVGKVLPDVEGEDEESHGMGEVVILFFTGIVMMVFLLLKAQFLPVRDARKNNQLGNIVSMSFAWCLYFSVYWFIQDELNDLAKGMLSEVVIALIVTLLGLGLIAVADKLADAEWTAPEIDKIIRGEVVTAIGILIGFSWEKNFDKAVACIALTTNSESHPEVPILVKMVMSVLCVGITVPAWWIYILPYLLKHKEELDKRMAVEKLNYMIKYKNMYEAWPFEVQEDAVGGKEEPLLKEKPQHGGHAKGGHGHEQAGEPSKRKVLKEEHPSGKEYGLAMMKVDESRAIAFQEFQCLLENGDYCMDFNEEGEWELTLEKGMEDKLKDLEKALKDKDLHLKGLMKDHDAKLQQIKQGTRIQELEDHNRILQQHINGYGTEIEELKRLADLLHEEHHK